MADLRYVPTRYEFIPPETIDLTDLNVFRIVVEWDGSGWVIREGVISDATVWCAEMDAWRWPARGTDCDWRDECACRFSLDDALDIAARLAVSKEAGSA